MKKQRVRCVAPFFDWLVSGAMLVALVCFGWFLLRQDAWRDLEIMQTRGETSTQTILELANFTSVHAKVACLFGLLIWIWHAGHAATVVLFSESILIVRWFGLYWKRIRAKELESVVFLGQKEGRFASNRNLLVRTKDLTIFNIGQSIKSRNLKTAKMISEMYGIPRKTAFGFFLTTGEKREGTGSKTGNKEDSPECRVDKAREQRGRFPDADKDGNR